MPRQFEQSTLTGSSIEDWDFATANTVELTHGLHPYPARMVPQIASRLIQTYSKTTDTVFDPFCGSGTVLLESLRLGRRSIGVDVNSLAVRISRAKTSSLNDVEIDKLNHKLLRTMDELKEESDVGLFVPNIHNIGYWFKKEVIQDLSIIRSAIERTVTDEDYMNFYNVCISSTIYDTANLDKRDNPYFLRTLKGKKLESFKPDAISSFWKKVEEARSKVRNLNRSLNEAKVKLFRPKIYLGDSRKMIHDLDPYELLLTSPPYGEEKNTMSYLRFSKIASYWLGNSQEELKEMEEQFLGSRPASSIKWKPKSLELTNLLDKLEDNDQPKRALEVKSFFHDYCDLLHSAYLKLRENGHFAIVIGNRTAKGAAVRNDLITQELCENLGLSHIVTHYRKIPKKVLPRSDSKGNLINAEAIVILEKS